MLFGAQQGGRPGFWKAQTLAFQELSVLSMWEWRSGSFNSTLPSPPPTPTTSCADFKQLARPVFMVWPFTPLWPCLEFHWLTFNLEARARMAKEHEMRLTTGGLVTLTTPFVAPSPPLAAGVPWVDRAPDPEGWGIAVVIEAQNKWKRQGKCCHVMIWRTIIIL